MKNSPKKSSEMRKRSPDQSLNLDSSCLEPLHVLKEFDFDSFLDNTTHSFELDLVADCENRAQAEYERRFMSWRCQGYAVLSNRFDDGVYISDHRAVVGDLVLT